MDSSRIYEDIKRRIVLEELQPGQQLIERDISDQYGISRTPIREILRRLITDGLVVLERSKGYKVRQLSIEEIIEIFLARETIEGTVIAVACERREEGLLAELEPLKQALLSADVETDPGTAVECGRQLHALGAEYARNAILLDFYRSLQNVAALTRNITRKWAVIEEQSRLEHLAIIDAIQACDSRKAEQLMRNHLRSTCRRIVDSYLRQKLRIPSEDLSLEEVMSQEATVFVNDYAGVGSREDQPR